MVRVTSRGIAALVAATAIFAISLAMLAPPSPSGVGAPALRLVAETDRAQYFAGETVRLTIRLENLAGESLVLRAPSTCVVSFIVYDAMGRSLYDHSRHEACGAAVTTITLPPRGMGLYEFSWSQTTDSGGPVPAEATYFVRGILLVPDVLLAASEGAGFYVMRGTQPGLFLQAFTDRPTYLAGEPVRITIRLMNRGQEGVVLQSTSSCIVAFAISDSGGVRIYDSKRHMGCLTVITTATLEPGAWKDFSFLWDQKDDAGGPVPVPGTYRVDGLLLAEGAFLAGSQGAEFAIVEPPPAG